MSGLATGVLAIGGVIHAQVFGLWKPLPRLGRYVVWALIAAVAARTVWSQLSAVF